MKHLITHSLLSSWLNVYQSYDAESAMDSFLMTLKREKTPTTDAMYAGRNFEADVYRLSNNEQIENSEWFNGAYRVSRKILGAATQVALSRDIEVKGDTFLVYGILDALKAGVIYDIKYTTRGLGGSDFYGKYLESTQHPTYMYLVPEAYQFEYLVSDGDDMYVETYTRKQTTYLGDIIKEFIDSLKSMDLYEMYKEHWKARE